MTIAGDTHDLDVQCLKVVQVFPDLLVVLTVAQPVELCALYIVVPVDHQANIIRKIGAIQDDMDLLLLWYPEDWRPLQVIMKYPLYLALAVTTSLCHIIKSMLANYPMTKPNE